MPRNEPDLSETVAHEALQVVKKEREITSEKITEMDRFHRKIHEMNSSEGTRNTGSRGGLGGVIRSVASATRDPGCVCQDVVNIFEDTVGGCEEGMGIERKMSAELGEGFAAVLLQDGEQGFSPDLKHGLLSSVEERQSQLRVLEESLGKEEESVRSTVELIESVNDSLVTEDELIVLGFDELRRSHGNLIHLREDCESRLERRQGTLSETTKEASCAGLRHTSLVEYLYEDLPSEHPVLSALTKAVRVCEEKEHEVREHICRAV